MKILLPAIGLLLTFSTAFASEEAQVSVCAKEMKAYMFLDTATSILSDEFDLTESKNPKARYMELDLKNSLSSISASKEIVEEKLLECRKKHPGEF